MKIRFTKRRETLDVRARVVASMGRASTCVEEDSSGGTGSNRPEPTTAEHLGPIIVDLTLTSMRMHTYMRVPRRPALAKPVELNMCCVYGRTGSRSVVSHLPCSWDSGSAGPVFQFSGAQRRKRVRVPTRVVFGVYTKGGRVVGNSCNETRRDATHDETDVRR